MTFLRIVNLQQPVAVSWAYRGLAQCAYDLRQVQRVISNSVENKVLELVDDTKQIFTERGHDGGVGLRCCAGRGGLEMGESLFVLPAESCVECGAKKTCLTSKVRMRNRLVGYKMYEWSRNSVKRHVSQSKGPVFATLHLFKKPNQLLSSTLRHRSWRFRRLQPEPMPLALSPLSSIFFSTIQLIKTHSIFSE